MRPGFRMAAKERSRLHNTTMRRLAKPMLFAAAFIWGSSFFIMKGAVDIIPTFYLLAFRFTGGAALLALVFWNRWRQMTADYWWRGAIIGGFLFLAYSVQTFGLMGTTPSKNAFLTAVYCVLVPFFYWAAAGKRPDRYNISAALLCVAGVGLVSLNGDLSVTWGDGLTLLCAVLFALHITTLGWAVKGTDVMRINLIQLSTAAIISVAVFLLTDLKSVSQANFASGFPAVLYLGLFSTCLCYFLQTLAQKHTTPSQAGILLSTEGLFGSLFSVLIGLEPLTVNLVVGGLLITASVVLMEVLPSPKSRRTKENAS